MADEQPEKKKSKLKLIIIAVILLLILAGGGVGAWMFLSGGDEDQQQNPAPVADPGMPKNMVSVPAPTFLVNLADPMGRRFIKLTIEFEVANAKVAEEINAQMPRVRDAINLLLSSKTYADLAPYENKVLLKNEIMERANQALGGVKIIRVNILEMVFQ